MRLRLHHDDNPEDEAPAPIPFPRDRIPGRSDDRRSVRNSISRGSAQPETEDAATDAEAALSDIQRGISELEELIDTLPFPASESDEGPHAA